MATKLGTLTLDLVAKIGSFVGPITDAESKVTKSFSKMREMVNQYGLVAVSAAAAATTALIAMANTMAQQNNELERFAYLAQTSVGEFQKVAVGAQMMGIEMDKLSDIFKDWNERSGDFLTTGGGPLVDFMEQVAIKTEKGAGGALKLAKELSRLSGPESMGLFVKKMEEANLSQDQMSFMMESMASDSTLLLPLLRNNAEGFKLWGEAAERAGILMDEQTLKSSRELQVQTKVLEMQYEGLKRELLSAVIPALVSVSGAMTEGNKEARGMASAGDVLANSLRGVASIAVGVYATLNLIAVAMAGVTKSAVDSYTFTQKAAEDGSWWDKLPGVKLLKGGLTFGVTASADNSGIGMAVEDSKRILEEGANTINGFFDNTTTKLAEAGAEFIRQANETKTAATKGTQDWVDKQNKATDATKAATKAQTDLNQKIAEQARLRETLIYEFSDKPNQMRLELEKKLSEISKAGFDAKDTADFTTMAKERFKAEKELYLAQQEFEINQHKYSEQKKLEEEFKLNNLRLNANTQMLDKEYQANLDGLKDRFVQEMAWLELEKQQRLLESRQFYMSDTEYMQERYQLERDEIAKNMQLTQQERDARIAMNLAEEEYEKRKNLKSASMAWGQTYADMTGSGESFRLEQERFNRYDDSQALFDSQMALAETAAEREAIWQAHNDRMLAIDEDYQTRSNQLSLSFGEQISGSYADIFKTIGGEQSGAYKAMFAVQKGFAIAQSIMAIQTGIANAMALPFPANLGAAATVAAETASIISNIQAVTLTGMAHDGIASIPEEGTWLLNKGERVLNPQDNKAFTDFINSQPNSEPNITINNNTGSNVSASRGVDGRVYVTIDEVENFVSQSLGRPNSPISKSLGQNTNAGRRR